MKLSKIFKFFVKQIEFKMWLQIAVNFILQFSIVLSEILFLSIFFLILNQSIDVSTFSLLIEKLEVYIFPIFESLTVTEIYILMLIGFLFLKNILLIIQSIYYNTIIFKLSADKSAQVLKSYMDKSYDVFSKKEISIYVKQLVRDVENVFVGIFGLIISFISEIIYVLVLAYYVSHLVSFNPMIEIYFIFVAIALILYLLFRVAKKYGEVRAYNEISFFKALTDTLNIFKEIKLLENTKDFIARYKNFLNKYYNSRIGAAAINLTPKFMFEIFLLITFFVIYKNESVGLNINEFVMKYSVLALALVRLIPSFARLSAYFSMILYNLNSVQFIEHDLNKKSSKNINKVNKKNTIKTMEIRGVRLDYINKDNSKLSEKFNSLNISLKKDNIYGVYGESGSGKSSLLNLLSGFIKPNKGKIFINNKNYNFYDLAKKFKIGYAPQIATILDENIIINSTLKFSNTNKKIEELKEYLEIFNLKKFVNKKYFENKNISSIKNMSGGEKQRIGFLRAVINEPDLILLDEPTSSLDKKNEKGIFDFLLSIKKDKIIVVTSHKEDQKKYFDEIINL
jgi:ABC-type bacteriocin/lantibiotic exporter with double-glycine peptidase domain